MTRHILDGERFQEIHPLFRKAAEAGGFWRRDLMARVASARSLRDMEGVPEDLQQLFVTAHQIAPAWHVRVQAAFQKHVDNAVSKTVNLPHEATVEDVQAVFRQAYQERCKGITVFRDRSRQAQVLVREVEPGRELEPAPLACNRPDVCARF